MLEVERSEGHRGEGVLLEVENLEDPRGVWLGGL